MFCLRGDQFNNMEDSHMYCKFFEKLWCPFTWSALFFNVVIIPSTHKRQRRSVELLHPVKEENFNLPQPGTHSCLHLIARRVTLSFQVFLHLRETEDIRSYIGILRQMQYSFSDRHVVSAISFPMSACVGSISHTFPVPKQFIDNMMDSLNRNPKRYAKSFCLRRGLAWICSSTQLNAVLYPWMWSVVRCKHGHNLINVDWHTTTRRQEFNHNR